MSYLAGYNKARYNKYNTNIIFIYTIIIQNILYKYNNKDIT